MKHPGTWLLAGLLVTLAPGGWAQDTSSPRPSSQPPSVGPPMVATTAPAAPIAVVIPTDPTARAFALGLALQMPTAQAEVFLQSVRGLRDAPDTSDAGSIKTLAQNAQTLRRMEADGYEQAAHLMQTMGAPPSLRGWVEGVNHLLTEPQIVSKDAKSYVKSEPETAAILSTIDEAEAIKVIADRNAAPLQTWLKLSQKAAGVWALTLGRLTAGMQTAATSSLPFLLPQATALTLHDTAPPGTPPAVVRALATLAPRGKGNLSYLLHLPTVTVPATQVAAPAQMILEAFGTQPLASTLTETP